MTTHLSILMCGVVYVLSTSIYKTNYQAKDLRSDQFLQYISALRTGQKLIWRKLWIVITIKFH